MPQSTNTLAARCLAELLGTFIIVLFGCGVVHSAVLTGAQSGLWQVAIVWGIGVTLAVFVTGAVSGAHLNPAITVALAVWGRCARSQVAPYIASQMLGGFAAAAILFVLYQPFLARHERLIGVARGQAGSELTAMCYGEFFPNPSGLLKPGETFDAARFAQYNTLVSPWTAALAEIVGTAVLALVIFALTDPWNSAAPLARLAPVFIGLTVALLISIIAPLTQACFNPARDFGPRAFAYFAGWGAHAFGPGASFFTVYMLAPTVGAILGGGVYLHLVRPNLVVPPPQGEEGFA